MHVAIEIGRWQGRAALKLQQLLKDELAFALWAQALELWVMFGDSRGRLPRDYDAATIAAHVRWRKKPAQLVGAFRSAGLATFKHGRWCLADGWKESAVGRYIDARAWDRQRQRDRRLRAAGGGGDPTSGDDTLPVTSSGRPLDNHQTIPSEGVRKSPDGPPDAPPGGGAAGKARWVWLLDHAERPRAADTCERLLGELSDENWALVQWVHTDARKGGAIRGRKLRALGLQTDEFLKKQGYLEFRREWKAALRKAEQQATSANGTGAAAPPPPDPDAFIRALLGDPDVTAEEKERQKRAWQKTNAGRTPPWEVA